MKYSINFTGRNESKEWAHYKWHVMINGVSFDYKTGLGHATGKVNLFGKRLWTKPAIKTISLEKEWVHVPEIDQVLECLFSDSQAGSESFNDFCDNFGYSNDSLKALDTYRECMDINKKLRLALGNDFNSERQRIEAKSA